MWIFFLEAGLALSLLIFIVWWTMFSGRKPDHSNPPEKLPLKDEASESSRE